MSTYTNWTDISATVQDEINHNKFADVGPGNYYWDGPPLKFATGVPVAAGGGQGTLPIATQFDRIEGKEQGITAIQLRGKATALVDMPVNQPMLSGKITGLRVLGGKTPFISRYSGHNVYDFQVMEDVALYGYSDCGIGNTSPDSPFWKLNRVQMQGLPGSIAIGLAGWQDECSLTDVHINGHGIGMKIGRGGPNLTIERCGTLHGDGDTTSRRRVDVWFVPEPGIPPPWYWPWGGPTPPPVAGGGMILSNFRLGNEGLKPTDLRILYADELPTGVNFCDPLRGPNLTRPSDGYIYAHTIEKLKVFGGGPPSAIVYSMVDKIVASSWGEQSIAQGFNGQPPMYRSYTGKPPLGKNNKITEARLVTA